MDTELEQISLNDFGSNEAGAGSSQQVTAENGGGVNNLSPEAVEREPFLHREFPGMNGETNVASHSVAQSLPQILPEFTAATQTKNNGVSNIKSRLKERVFWEVRLWMALVFLFLLILAVIAISLILCQVIHEDLDEKYDLSSFKVPLNFNGSFQLPNQNFTSELYSLSSNQSQMLSTELQEKLSALYRASPALGRYFSNAKIYAFRNGSVTAQFWLKFLMPAEHSQLEKFTLSRELVYNVFRQFLYDQEMDQQGLMYIDPTSLSMF